MIGINFLRSANTFISFYFGNSYTYAPVVHDFYNVII